MKNLLFACFVVLTFACSSFANLMIVPLDEAVKNSDIIIVGTLRDISEKSEDFATYGKGTIVVDEFIAGNVSNENGFAVRPDDRLALNYVENFACVMGSHKRIENEKGIFLLTLNDTKEIQYKDFRSLENLPEIKKLLKKGIKPNQIPKIINISNNAESISQFYSPKDSSEEITKYLHSVEDKGYEFAPFSAVLVVLISFAFYCFLYRSRFKIR